jgi:hypothetical protein
MIFCGNSHYSSRSHPYWCNKNNGKNKMRGPPTQVSTSTIVKCVERVSLWLQGPRNWVGAKQDPIHKNGIK